MYWPHMADDVYARVRNYRTCAQNRVHGKKQMQLTLLFPNGALEYFGMDVIERLPKTKEGN